MVDLGNTIEEEHLLLMKCRSCTHTFYRPITELGKVKLWALKWLHIKQKKDISCPACEGKSIFAVKKHTRKKLVANRKGESKCLNLLE